MTRFRFATLSAAVALAFAAPQLADAQQRTPQAVSQAGVTVNAAPNAITVAPAGGGMGKGRPVAEDLGIPLIGRNLTSHAKCTIGLDDVCGIPGTGGGGGGGDASAANQATQITAAGVANGFLSTIATAVSAPSTAITAAALPLPSGASTLTAQNTGNTSLATIATNTTGAATAAAQATANTSLSTLATASASQATAANQTAAQANAGSDATKAIAVQGITGAKPINSNISAVTTGGATPYHLITANTTNSTLISTGAHTLYDLELTGLNTSAGYLRLYDSASAPTCSSATGAVKTLLVIGSATQQGGIIVPLPPQGVAFVNGLAYCFTGGPTDTDNTAGPAGALINLDYK